MCDESVDLERIEHRGQQGLGGGRKSDVELSICGAVPISAVNIISGQVPWDARERVVAVEVDIELPGLAVLEVSKVQEHHELNECSVFPHDVKHGAIPGHCDGLLEDC